MSTWGERARARARAARRRTPFGEAPDDECYVLYHVTYSGHLGSIAENGLDPRRTGVWEGSGYGAHSKRGTFLTEGDGVQFWYNRLEEQADHHQEAYELEDWVPVVLRALCVKDDGRLVEDKAGSRDALSDSYITTQMMPPEDLQMWDGTGWSEVESFDAADAAGMVETEHGWQFPAFGNRLVPPESELEE